MPWGYTIRPFSSIELACAVRQPGPCVRALCEAVAVLLSENMTCARPRRNATKSEHFLHTSHCTLHTSHFTLHICTSHPALHLISNDVNSSHLISPDLRSSHLGSYLLTCHLSNFFSTVFIPSQHYPFSFPEVLLNSAQLFCAPERSYCQRESLAQKIHWAQKAFAHRILRHRCIYTEKPFKHTLYYKAYTQYFPVLLCTTKLAQGISQYYFVLQSLHKIFTPLRVGWPPTPQVYFGP